jgi:hypothetical protein|tara:strand:+ start:580 stop:1659 length:1080 start_codon:yes stop_codon:yes gene_type:complete
MSRGKSLQEMEVKTQQSRTAVNSSAKAGDSMPTMADPGTQLGSVEDLGGPTPENYRPDDDSAKLKTPGGSLKQVTDVVNKGAGKADSTPTMKKEEEDYQDEEVLAETEEVEDELVEDAIDVEEDVNALLGGEELSEEFREKAKTIFEAALKSKISDVKEQLEAQYSVALDEEVEEMKVELQERVDSYLEYVADEWLQENELAVERGLKTEMTESFMEGMKSLFEEHYVSIPEEKYDVLSAMTDKLDDMETKLNEQIEKNIGLNKRLGESVATSILGDVSEGLAQTQKEKLASLAEGVEFESEESFKEKLTTLRESYFSETKSVPQSSADTISEGVDHTDAPSAAGMTSYLDILSKMNTK